MPEPSKAKTIDTYREPEPQTPLLDAVLEATAAREERPVLSATTDEPSKPEPVAPPAFDFSQINVRLLNAMKTGFNSSQNTLTNGRQNAPTPDVVMSPGPSESGQAIPETAVLYDGGEMTRLIRICRDCGATVCGVAEMENLYIYVKEESYSHGVRRPERRYDRYSPITNSWF